jgi:hypothetical protein
MAGGRSVNPDALYARVAEINTTLGVAITYRDGRVLEVDPRLGYRIEGVRFMGSDWMPAQYVVATWDYDPAEFIVPEE